MPKKLQIVALKLYDKFVNFVTNLETVEDSIQKRFKIQRGFQATIVYRKRQFSSTSYQLKNLGAKNKKKT
jgi:hypothetical protein